jgi:hypothetical protein
MNKREFKIVPRNKKGVALCTTDKQEYAKYAFEQTFIDGNIDTAFEFFTFTAPNPPPAPVKQIVVKQIPVPQPTPAPVPTPEPEFTTGGIKPMREPEFQTGGIKPMRDNSSLA